MATMQTIAHELDVGANALRRIVDRAYRAGNVSLGYQKTAEGNTYDADAVKVAAFPFLPDLRIQKMQHEREERVRAKATDPDHPAPSKPKAPPRLTPSHRRQVRTPEVIIMRRRPQQEEKR